MIYVPFYKSFPTANGANDVTFEQAGQQPTVRSEMPSAAENFLSQDAKDPAGQEKPLFPPGPRMEGVAGPLHPALAQHWRPTRGI